MLMDCTNHIALLAIKYRFIQESAELNIKHIKNTYLFVSIITRIQNSEENTICQRILEN